MVTTRWPGRAMLVTACALAALGAATPIRAADLAGDWGSSLYRVALSVSGSRVTGHFEALEAESAPRGTISGEVQPGGEALAATWTVATDLGEATFETWLTLDTSGEVLSGYRWTDEAQPTSFALHRAVDGEIPALLSDDSPADPPPVETTGDTPKPPPPTDPDGAAEATIEVVICEEAVDGVPRNVGTVFTAPKSLVALVRYHNLAPDTPVRWDWTLDGAPEATLTRALSGDGWHTHGLKAREAIIPGLYVVTVSLDGREIVRQEITVHGASTAPPVEGAGATLEVITCASVSEGGEPIGQGTTFTRPKSIACLVRYGGLPAGSEIHWVWRRGEARVAERTRTVEGTGWAWHGLSSDVALTPGAYRVTVSARGERVTETEITVR